MRPTILIALALILTCSCKTGTGNMGMQPKQYNVLFIAVDDLRPVLGCYGDSIVKTPNLDALASQGMVFHRAYCETPQCLPSRTTILTGLRAESTGIFSNRDGHFRANIPDHVTLPQYFKRNGYFCMEFGKIFHHQDKVSYSAPKFLPRSDYAYPIYGNEESVEIQKSLPDIEKGDNWWGFQKERNTRWIRGLSWESPDVPDSILFDGQLANGIIRALQMTRDQPFFFATGFFRPHLPFIAPKKYYDLYPAAKLKLPENLRLAENVPEFATRGITEPRTYYDLPREGRISEARQLELLRGYFASVSYVDAQIGRVFDELERLNLLDRTIIVVWSDHGYHFGEHGAWSKNTNFEEATRSTLIVSHPDLGSPNQHTHGLVELVDLYPTLCEMNGLEIPAGLEGNSFVPLLENPDQAWKTAVFSRAKPGEIQGYTMRTQRYRYTEWKANEEILAVEVYDHDSDPEENINLASAPEFKTLTAKLKLRFDSGWSENFRQ